MDEVDIDNVEHKNLEAVIGILKTMPAPKQFYTYEELRLKRIEEHGRRN